MQNIFQTSKKQEKNKETKKEKEKRTKENYVIPGMGKKPRQCRGIIPIKCSEPSSCTLEWLIANGNCNQPQCPDCWNDWRYKRVEKAFEHILSNKITYKQRVAHIVVSPPQDKEYTITTNKQKQELAKKARKILKQHQIQGAMEIFHPYRIEKKVKKLLKQLAKEYYPDQDTDTTTWKTLHKLCKEQGLNWKDYCYISPHFHYIGVFTWMKQAQKREDGWIIKKVGNDRTPEGIVKTSMYLLSHMGINTKENTKNILWVGSLSTNQWSMKKAHPNVQKYVILKKQEILLAFKQKEHYGLDSMGYEFISIKEAKLRIDQYPPEKRILIQKAYIWNETGRPPIKKYYDQIMK